MQVCTLYISYIIRMIYLLDNLIIIAIFQLTYVYGNNIHTHTRTHTYTYTYTHTHIYIYIYIYIYISVCVCVSSM